MDILKELFLSQKDRKLLNDREYVEKLFQFKLAELKSPLTEKKSEWIFKSDENHRINSTLLALIAEINRLNPIYESELERLASTSTSLAMASADCDLKSERILNHSDKSQKVVNDSQEEITKLKEYLNSLIQLLQYRHIKFHNNKVQLEKLLETIRVKCMRSGLILAKIQRTIENEYKKDYLSNSPTHSSGAIRRQIKSTQTDLQTRLAVCKRDVQAQISSSLLRMVRRNQLATEKLEDKILKDYLDAGHSLSNLASLREHLHLQLHSRDPEPAKEQQTFAKLSQHKTSSSSQGPVSGKKERQREETLTRPKGSVAVKGLSSSRSNHDNLFSLLGKEAIARMKREGELGQGLGQVKDEVKERGQEEDSVSPSQFNSLAEFVFEFSRVEGQHAALSAQKRSLQTHTDQLSALLLIARQELRQQGVILDPSILDSPHPPSTAHRQSRPNSEGKTPLKAQLPLNPSSLNQSSIESQFSDRSGALNRAHTWTRVASRNVEIRKVKPDSTVEASLLPDSEEAKLYLIKILNESLALEKAQAPLRCNLYTLSGLVSGANQSDPLLHPTNTSLRISSMVPSSPSRPDESSSHPPPPQSSTSLSLEIRAAGQSSLGQGRDIAESVAEVFNRKGLSVDMEKQSEASLKAALALPKTLGLKKIPLRGLQKRIWRYAMGGKGGGRKKKCRNPLYARYIEEDDDQEEEEVLDHTWDDLTAPAINSALAMTPAQLTRAACRLDEVLSHVAFEHQLSQFKHTPLISKIAGSKLVAQRFLTAQAERSMGAMDERIKKRIMDLQGHDEEDGDEED